MMAVVFLSASAIGADDGPVAWWKFDQEGKVATDSVSGIGDKIRGNFKYVEGVYGCCIKFDENTTAIVRKGDDAPQLAGSFTIEAWIAPQAYPWNWGSNSMAALKINGKTIDPGKTFRQGIIRDTDGTQTLVIWVKAESTKPMKLALIPNFSQHY